MQSTGKAACRAGSSNPFAKCAPETTSGATGTASTSDPTGIASATGSMGVNGAMGPTSSSSALGSTGATGTTGLSRSTSATGTAGATGSSGYTGPTGAASSSTKGTTGSAGTSNTGTLDIYRKHQPPPPPSDLKGTTTAALASGTGRGSTTAGSRTANDNTGSSKGTGGSDSIGSGKGTGRSDSTGSSDSTGGGWACADEETRNSDGVVSYMHSCTRVPPKVASQAVTPTQSSLPGTTRLDEHDCADGEDCGLSLHGGGSSVQGKPATGLFASLMPSTPPGAIKPNGRDSATSSQVPTVKVTNSEINKAIGNPNVRTRLPNSGGNGFNQNPQCTLLNMPLIAGIHSLKGYIVHCTDGLNSAWQEAIQVSGKFESYCAWLSLLVCMTMPNALRAGLKC